MQKGNDIPDDQFTHIMACLAGGRCGVGRQNDILRIAQNLRDMRFFSEHIQCRSGYGFIHDMLTEGFLIHHRPSCDVNQKTLRTQSVQYC